MNIVTVAVRPGLVLSAIGTVIAVAAGFAVTRDTRRPRDRAPQLIPPLFETRAARYEWLNHIISVGVYQPGAGHIAYGIFPIL